MINFIILMSLFSLFLALSLVFTFIGMGLYRLLPEYIRKKLEEGE